MTPEVPTVTELLLARTGDDTPGLRFEHQEWSWSEHVRGCMEHASLLNSLRRPGRPFHIGVLLDNVPEFSFLLGAAALSGAVIVGLNPNRRGAALARDIRIADCQLIVTERRHEPLLEGIDLEDAAGHVLVVDSPEWTHLLTEHRGHSVDPAPAEPDDLLALVFTSGTGGDPKAVRCTHGKIAFPGRMLADRFALTPRDVVYLSMPMFHSNALLAGWAVGLSSGAALALRRKFSASSFLPDIRRFGATYANYVGKPLSHVLATPPRSDDADNPLRLVYGNEGADRDLTRFSERFDCHVVDGFGSTEGGVAIQRTPDAPAGSLGLPGEGVTVLSTETGEVCAPARFDTSGRVANPDEAIGELVNTDGPGSFAGYYGAPEADAQRLRAGMYWSGDLAYLDTAGFCYFVGRSDDWMRVDGENLGTAPIERALLRHPGIAEAAVYAVPDPDVGDQVMVTVVPQGRASSEPGSTDTGAFDTGSFDTVEFAAFLATQEDLGPKQIPRFLRVTSELPRTATHKVLKRDLAAQRWICPDPVWWRPTPESAFQRLTPEQASELDAASEKRG